MGDLHYEDDALPVDDWSADAHLLSVLTQDTLICCIIICIVAIVGLIGNALMLRAWIKYPKLRNDFYTVFAAISLIDILFIVISVPASIAEMLVPDINTESFCKASKYLIYVTGFISSYLIAVLAALRLILLTNRNLIPRPTAVHLMVVSVCSYILIFPFSIPIINMYTSLDKYCYFHGGFDDRMQTWLLNSFSAFVPLFLVGIFYLISFILGKRYFADSYSPRVRQKSLLVSCVMLAFFICQVPYRILSIYEVYLHPSDDSKTLENVIVIKDYLTCVLLAGKAVRPILCSKLTKDLGHAFDEIINCQSCQKRNNRANEPLVQPPLPQPELLSGANNPIPPPIAADFDPESDPESDPEPPSPLVDVPPRSRMGVDRTISTSSTASVNSQAPLIRHSSSSSPSEMEMI